jgi:3-oxoacyl-[acyl-carrier protein] reductase
MRVKDKVVIVTGGASGLGKETCFVFASEGAQVVIADYNVEEAKKVENEIIAQGGQAFAIFADVSKQDSVETMVSTIVEKFGKIDVLINNAGITADSTLLKMSEEQWDRVIDINQKGVFLCTKAVAPHMVAQKSGRIINTSSIVGKMGNFGQTNYAATKAAVIGMTQTWAKELGRKGINVNAVAPGFIATPMTEKMPENVLADMKAKVAVQRLGLPRDVANAYLFLASDDSSYVNGSVLSVDGGLSI